MLLGQLPNELKSLIYEHTGGNTGLPQTNRNTRRSIRNTTNAAKLNTLYSFPGPLNRNQIKQLYNKVIASGLSNELQKKEFKRLAQEVIRHNDSPKSLTTMIMAIRLNNTRLVRQLKEAFPDIKFKDVSNTLLTHPKVKSSTIKYVYNLFGKTPDINTLTAAIYIPNVNDRSNLLKYVVQKGKLTNKNVVNSIGLAVSANRLDVVKYLTRKFKPDEEALGNARVGRGVVNKNTRNYMRKKYGFFNNNFTG